MPDALVTRTFVTGGFYHVFNRGNDKAAIFHDRKDYEFFLSLLDCYLVKNSPYRTKWTHCEYADSVRLLAYCLMPNHFHFLIQQVEERAMSSFLHSLSIRYAKYYQQKYKSVGHVFQGPYKARLVQDDIDFLHLTRYIHMNPKNFADPGKYPYSSFQFYLHPHQAPRWVDTTKVFDTFFSTFSIPQTQGAHAYKEFVLVDSKL